MESSFASELHSPGIILEKNKDFSQPVNTEQKEDSINAMLDHA